MQFLLHIVEYENLMEVSVSCMISERVHRCLIRIDTFPVNIIQ